MIGENLIKSFILICKTNNQHIIHDVNYVSPNQELGAYSFLQHIDQYVSPTRN